MDCKKLSRFGFCVFPRYKYCGPGCSGPGAPINTVDTVCKVHDICYQRHGPCYECDLVFLCRLKPLTHKQTIEGIHARVIYMYMKLQLFIRCFFMLK